MNGTTKHIIATGVVCASMIAFTAVAMSMMSEPPAPAHGAQDTDVVHVSATPTTEPTPLPTVTELPTPVVVATPVESLPEQVKPAPQPEPEVQWHAMDEGMLICGPNAKPALDYNPHNGYGWWAYCEPALVDEPVESITFPDLPACEQEDSENCYWDATVRGNGEGQSFVHWNGEVIYYVPAEETPTEALEGAGAWR